jgi:TetR/AcrR family transcriptional repressor of nem operon
MRKSVVETAQTRERIVEAAARRFLDHGINTSGVAELMADVGLTQGGFYRHFSSKAALTAEAAAFAFDGIANELEMRIAARRPRDRLSALISAYLSVEHRDNAADGCPLAALGSELAREDDEVRDEVAAGIESLTGLIGEQFDASGARNRALSLTTLATMVGALTMARACGNAELSAELLSSVGKQLKQFVAASAR